MLCAPCCGTWLLIAGIVLSETVHTGCEAMLLMSATEFIASKIAGRVIFVDVACLTPVHLGLTADVPASWLKSKYTLSVTLMGEGYKVYLSKFT